MNSLNELRAMKKQDKASWTKSQIHKSQMIFDAVDRFSGDFRVSDVQRICPGVSLDLIRRRLKDLKAAGKVEPSGRGPSAVWRKMP